MNVAEIRKRAKLTKYAFAKKVGVSWNTVHLWEKQIWEPNKINIKKIKELCK